MPISLQEIKNATCGENAEGKSKAISIIGAHNYNLADTSEDPTVIAEFSSVEPIVSIVIGPEITWISLKFISGSSHDLSLFFRTLERYLDETDSNTKTKEAVAFVSFLPLELTGQYYITALHPILWALEPESAGEDLRTLRIAFFSENVSFLESDLDDNFFEKALAEATGNDYTNDSSRDESEYGRTERDLEFLDAEKYLSYYDDDEDNDDDDDEDEDDDFDDIDDDNDRKNYVYN